MDGSTSGVIVGRLTAVLADRITVGPTTVYLRPGMVCNHAIGTHVAVSYTERDGRAEASSIEPREIFR